jgi:hypothetical protein
VLLKRSCVRVACSACPETPSRRHRLRFPPRARRRGLSSMHGTVSAADCRVAPNDIVQIEGDLASAIGARAPTRHSFIAYAMIARARVSRSISTTMPSKAMSHCVCRGPSGRDRVPPGSAEVLIQPGPHLPTSLFPSMRHRSGSSPLSTATARSMTSCGPRREPVAKSKPAGLSSSSGSTTRSCSTRQTRTEQPTSVPPKA